MRLICPYCNSILARIDDDVKIQGSVKCPKCGRGFGFTNIKGKLERLY